MPALRVVPTTPLPSPQATGLTSDALLVLQPRPDFGTAVRVVDEYFAAISREDLACLESLFEKSAHHLRNVGGDRRNALSFWRLRFASKEYGSPAARRAFRSDRIEIFDPLTLPLAGNGQGPEVSLESSGEVLARVALDDPGRASYFAREVLLRLRPHGTSFRIAEIIEDFDLP